MRSQIFHGHDRDRLGSRDVISQVTIDSQYMVSYRWSFEINPISRMLVSIFCVKHLAKHILIEDALIPIYVF